MYGGEEVSLKLHPQEMAESGFEPGNPDAVITPAA